MSYHLRKGRSARTIRAARAVNPQPTPIEVPRDIQRYYWKLGYDSAIKEGRIATINASQLIQIATNATLEITPASLQQLVSHIVGHSPKAWAFLQFQLVRSSTSDAFPNLEYEYHVGDHTEMIETLDGELTDISDGAITCFGPPYNVNNSSNTYFPHLTHSSFPLTTDGVSSYVVSPNFSMENHFDWMNSDDGTDLKLTIRNMSSSAMSIRLIFKIFDIE